MKLSCIYIFIVNAIMVSFISVMMPSNNLRCCMVYECKSNGYLICCLMRYDMCTHGMTRCNLYCDLYPHHTHHYDMNVLFKPRSHVYYQIYYQMSAVCQYNQSHCNPSVQGPLWYCVCIINSYSTLLN